MRILTLLPILLAACTPAAFPPEAPKPAPHGPIAAPTKVEARPDDLVANLRSSDYPEARLESRADGERSFRVALGASRTTGLVEPIAMANRLASDHSTTLGLGPTGAFQDVTDGPNQVLIMDSFPPRDSGCSRVRLRIELSSAPSGKPLTLSRTCSVLRPAPPDYRSRALPSTALGAADILAKVGTVGGLEGARFHGRILDRYGDVYEATDPASGPQDEKWKNEPFLVRYVKTLPPLEVEQLALDVALASEAQESPAAAALGADIGGSVYEGTAPGERAGGVRIDLERRSGPASQRAKDWLRRNVER